MNIWIRLLPASLLVTTGTLKLYGLFFTSPWLQRSSIIPTKLELAISIVEIVFALWILFVGNRASDWLVCFGLFWLFAATSLFVALLGQTSCGCFGVVETSPWLAFVTDLFFIFYLWAVRPIEFDKSAFGTNSIGRLVMSFLILFGVGSSIFQFTDAGNSLRKFFLGEIVCTSADGIWIGSGEIGETKDASVEFENLSDRAILIYGAHGTVDDLTIGLPIEVQARTSRAIPIRVAFRGSTGLFSRRVVFYTSSKRNSRVVVRLNGKVEVDYLTRKE